MPRMEHHYMAGLDKILTGAMECKVARVTYHW